MLWLTGEELFAQESTTGWVETLSSPVPSNEMAENEDTAVYLAYFYDPTCLECAQVSKEVAHLQTQYPNLVVQASWL